MRIGIRYFLICFQQKASYDDDDDDDSMVSSRPQEMRN